MSVTVLRPGETRSPAPSALADVIGRGLVTHGLVSRASERVVRTGADQVLPVRADLRPLLPWPGLRRGSVVAVTAGSPPAPGSTSLLLAVLAEAIRAGSWGAVVGIPALGAMAAAELGANLERLALVPDPGTEWPTVVAALIDGLDLVAVRPSHPISASLARRLAARVKQRGGVVVSYGPWDGADVTLHPIEQRWQGLGQGHGRLRSRRLSVVSYGRGAAARPRTADLWLPGGPPDTPAGAAPVSRAAEESEEVAS